MFLTGRVRSATTPVYAEFGRCGQGIRVGGDVKLRGVLVGRIGKLINAPETPCRIRLDLMPEAIEQIPANVGAQIRAKTVFGEKWVGLIYPEDSDGARIAAEDTIPSTRTLDPLEVEALLDIALPLLDAIQPDRLAGALEALAEGFSSQEDEVITAIEDGQLALRPLNRNRDQLIEGLRQLNEAGQVLDEVDADLLQSFKNLENLNQFSIKNQALLEETLEKAPQLFSDLSQLFRVSLVDFVDIANTGATVISLVAAQAGDVERLLEALPPFDHAWIRNLNAACPVRFATTEPGLSRGDPVPGRCWRVHNIVSESQGAYAPGEEPGPDQVIAADYGFLGLGVLNPIDRIMWAPQLPREARR